MSVSSAIDKPGIDGALVIVIRGEEMAVGASCRRYVERGWGRRG